MTGDIEVKSASIKILLMVSLFFIACDSGSNDANSVTDVPDSGPTNNTNNQNNENNRPDMDVDMPVDPTEGCTQVRELDANDLGMIEREFEQIFGYSTPSCEGEATPTGAYIYQLEFDESTQVTVDLRGIPKMEGEIVIPPQPILEIRKGSCQANPEIVSCEAQRSHTFVAEPGVPYFLVVAGELDSGGYTIEFSTNAAVCEVGPTECSEASFKNCIQGSELEEWSCTQTCRNEATCNANVCTDALELDLLVGGAPVVVNGHRNAYSSGWTAQARQGCETEDGVESPDTPGVETWIRIPNVLTGQKVVLDATEDNENYGFFLQSDCADQGCISAGVFDTLGDNRHEYTAESDGDILVAIESLGPSQQDFAIRVSLEL